MDEAEVRRVAREELSSAMAAALADPAVDEGGKSLAGYVLQWLEGEPAKSVNISAPTAEAGVTPGQS